MADNSGDEQGTPAQIAFFRQLHSMISNESSSGSNSIEWLPDGTAFVVVHKKKLSDEIIPLYFGHAKFTSFTRRLKRWGFKRLSNGGAYYHAKFYRDMAFEEEDPQGIPSPDKKLPPKKRAKHWSPSSSPRASPSEDEQFARYEDVTVMPQLMRTINRDKRIERLGKKEEETEDFAPPQSMNMMTHYRDSRMANNNNNSLEAAQALVSLEQQNSQSRNSFGFNDTLPLYNNQEMRYNNPSHYPRAYSSGTNLERLSQNETSLRDAYESLERRVIHEEMRSQLNLERRMREEIALSDMMTRMNGERLNRREVMRTQPQPQSWPRMMNGVQQPEPQPQMNRNLGNADHCLHASLPPSWPRMMSSSPNFQQPEPQPQMNRTLNDGRRDAMHQPQPQSWPRMMSNSVQQATSPQRNRVLDDTVSKDEDFLLKGLSRLTSDSRLQLPDGFCAPQRRKGGFNRAA